MEFPVFHLDYSGDRLLVAVVAVLHVLINHTLAVGAFPLILLFERIGVRTGDRRWDLVARGALKVCFIVTTTVGALSGVGIWFAVALVNPAAIASLIRVFFAAWFVEWLVFVAEVCLILAYYLTWDRWQGALKGRHLAVGAALSAFSWITMALIVAILGFMMDVGAWQKERTLLSGVFNPLYAPQLVFRTAAAAVCGGFFLWFLTTRAKSVRGAFRASVVRTASTWIVCWTPVLIAAGFWYQSRIPTAMRANVPTAMLTQDWASWSDAMLKLNLVLGGAALAAAAFGVLAPRRVPRSLPLLPLILGLVQLGEFERVREFIRKPYVIADYMFANGLRVVDVPLFQREGLLAHAPYARVREVTPFNHPEAGREVFLLACARCHTTGGVNSIAAKTRTLFAGKTPTAEALDAALASIHGARPFMPPFPGSPEERRALSEYLVGLLDRPEAAPGVQETGLAPAAPWTSPQRVEHLAAGLEAARGGPKAIRPSQAALSQLADLPATEADAVLERWLGRVEKGEAAPELRLDVLDAAARRPALEPRVRSRREALAAAPPAERFAAALAGGDAERGAKWFVQRACASCHRWGGSGGAVGPDLGALAGKRSRAELLESIVAPNARIAEGFQAVNVITVDGATVLGIVRKEDDQVLELATAAGKVVSIPKDEIEERLPAPSMMPDSFGKTLPESEIRDLVELLSTPSR